MSSPVPFADARAILTSAALTTTLEDGVTVVPVPFAWQNEAFENPEPPQIWCAVSCTSQVLAPIELGADVWQEEGELLVHVATPQGWGSGSARAMAKTIATLFRGLGPRNVVWLGGSIGNGQYTDDTGAWWILTVTMRYRYQDITTP